MSTVQDRLNANKPPPPAADAKGAKHNGTRDLDLDPKKDEASFFGSFFSTARKGQPKKGPVMDSVSTIEDNGLFDSVNIRQSCSRLRLSDRNRL